MDVIVDNERNFRVEGEPSDVLAVLGAVSDFLRQQKRGIMMVRVDNEDIAPDSVAESLKDRDIASVGTLEVRSGDLAEMMTSTLDSLHANLPELPKACRELAEVFHSENPESGFDPFQELAQIWEHVKNQENLVLSALNLKSEEVVVNGQNLMGMHEELNGFLTEAVEALKTRDLVLLGDLLEYELAPRAEQEMEIVNALRSNLSERPA